MMFAGSGLGDGGEGEKQGETKEDDLMGASLRVSGLEKWGKSGIIQAHMND